MNQNLDFFRCLICQSNSVNISNHFLICASCGQTYPVINDIPILVLDWEKKRIEIEKLTKTQPGWFIEEQLSETTSPWKHHLTKRMLYVEDSLKKYLINKKSGKAENILDLGCGDGTQLFNLQIYSKVIYGSDYNFERLVRAKNLVKNHNSF